MVGQVNMSALKSLSGLTLIVLAGILLLLPACGNNKSFDSAAWLKANARDRGRMSQDLVDRKLLVGKSVEQAKQALGEPQKDWGSVVQYDIDLGWLFKDPRHYGLQVHFEADQRVSEVRIVD